MTRLQEILGRVYPVNEILDDLKPLDGTVLVNNLPTYYSFEFEFGNNLLGIIMISQSIKYGSKNGVPLLEVHFSVADKTDKEDMKYYSILRTVKSDSQLSTLSQDTKDGIEKLGYKRHTISYNEFYRGLNNIRDALNTTCKKKKIAIFVMTTSFKHETLRAVISKLCPSWVLVEANKDLNYVIYERGPVK